MKTERQSRGGREESGFSLLEMILATAVLLMGLVGVAQLVPASLLLNQQNRSNSSSLVIAQQEMDQIVNQPLTIGGANNPGFTDTGGNFVDLGDSTQPGQVVGSPLVLANNSPLIDFSQAQVPGYSFNYQDPNDPTQATWDVRWAVITNVNAGVPISKRFIVGAHQIGGAGFVLPVTLDTTVAK
jgi:type II secretory pathway pseudopilin PulG